MALTDAAKQRLKVVLYLLSILLYAGAIWGAYWLFPGWPYLWVTLFGVGVGAGEMVSRYRDAPERALTTRAAWIYLGVNGAAAAAALKLMEVFDWLKAGTTAQTTATRILTAGFGALAFFRSSLLLVRVGDHDVQVGPISFLQAILNATDRAVDRWRGQWRAADAAQMMAGVNFDKAINLLVPLCLDALQNLSDEDNRQLASELAKLNQNQVDRSAKAISLGLKLMNAVGRDVLEASVSALAPYIKDAAVLRIDPISLHAGETKPAKATALDSTGKEIAGKHVDWGTADISIATVDALGYVRAVSAGNTRLEGKADGVTASVEVTVS